MASIALSSLRNGRIGTLLVTNPLNRINDCTCGVYSGPVGGTDGGKPFASITNVLNSTKPKPKLSFQDYRKVKKRIKFYSRISGAVMGTVAIISSAVAVNYYNPELLTAPPEEVQLIYGMDPAMVSVLGCTAGGIAGYLIGASVVSFLWTSRKKELRRWDADFLKRLQKHRFEEINKFDDDYYGDKVMTLSDYRQWIRRQHKKRDSVQSSSKTTN